MGHYDDMWDWDEDGACAEMDDEFDRRGIFRKCQRSTQSASLTAPLVKGSLWGARVRVRGPPEKAG